MEEGLTPMKGSKRSKRPTAETAKPTKAAPPDHLTMNLFAPGMSALHRAGLGGLACTLRAMERQHRAGQLKVDRLPGLIVDGKFPWEVDEQSVTLRFGKPENAGDFLKLLFAFAFEIRPDGLISLPGQHDGGKAPSAAVLADLQLGILLTFLQHGLTRKLDKNPSTVTYDLRGDGLPDVVVEYKRCSEFKHQAGWEELVDTKGCLSAKPIRVEGPISPGTVVRHVVFGANTVAEEMPALMLPLYFAIVGSMPLAVNRGVGVLLIPEVENLEDFVLARPMMTPTAIRETQIANAADAALQAQVRLRGREAAQHFSTPGCYAMTLRPTPWASQQKSRVATIHVPPGDDKVLDRFNIAWSKLPPRIATRTIKESTGKGKTKITTERQESFRTDSVIRPLIAENLALGRPWYQDFVRLMTKINPATDKPYRNQLIFERKGLHAMIADTSMWDHEGEKLVVDAVHEAIGRRLGQIRSDTDGPNAKGLSQATKNRWERFREKLRLDLAGAKTESHVRFALMDLFSRAGINNILRGGWEKVLPVIRKDWHLARDLGLLALASYAGKGESEEAPDQSA